MQMTVPRPREQALEQIMAYMLENKLSADDKLPPEREMCQMWGVNRCTLRSAIAALTEHDYSVLRTLTIRISLFCGKQ